MPSCFDVLMLLTLPVQSSPDSVVTTTVSPMLPDAASENVNEAVLGDRSSNHPDRPSRHDAETMVGCSTPLMAT